MGRYMESGAVVRNISTKSHGVRKALNEVKVENTTIVCLGGDMTYSANKIEDLCKSVESVIGLRVDGPQHLSTYNDMEVIGFYYGKDNETDKTYCFSEEDRDAIVQNTLLPLCVDVDGNLLPLEEICKNFSRMIFFTHCHGATELCKITEKLHNILLEKGLTNEQAHKIYEQSFHCSYASNCRESYYPTMYVFSLTDGCYPFLKHVYKEYYGEVLDGVSIKYDPPGKHMTENISSRDYYKHVHHDSIIVFTSRLVNKQPNNLLKSVYDEHSYCFLDRDIMNWGFKADGDSVYSPNADLVSKMVAYAMAINIVASLNTARTGKITKRISILDLKAELENLINTFDQEDLKIQR